ncbi:riboflavin kinase, partial [Acaromyces ingoldii]
RPLICGSYAPERPYPIYLRGIVEKGFGRGGKELGCPTANLPSKVVGPQSPLTRTGIYFGFARVLPQDPDDPDLVDEGDAEASADGQAINFTEEEDFDIDDDGDEVVLGASPVADAFGDQKDWTEGRPLTKPRQMSKSSMKTALQEQNRAEQQQQQQQSKEERRPRNHSSNSSSSSLLRRGKKKPRIPIAPEDTRVFPMVMSVGWNPYYQNTSKTAEVHIMHQFPRDFYGLETRVVVLGYIRPEYNYVSVESLKDDIETDKRVAINSLARPHYQDYGTDPFL